MKRSWIMGWLLMGSLSLSLAQQPDNRTDSTTVIKQLPLTEYDRIEPTVSEKYVLVYKDSLCGVYDVVNRCNVSEMKYTSLRVRNRSMTEVGPVTVFVYTQGDQSGLLGLFEENNQLVTIGL